MIITGSDITMTSSHVETQKYSRRESLSVWAGTKRPHGHHHHGHDRMELSKEAREAEKELGKSDGKECGCDGSAIEPKLQLFKSIIERLTGSRIRLMAEDRTRQDVEGAATEQVKGESPPAEPKSAGFGVSYEFHESYREAEITDFSAAGVVKTADGRSIDLSLDLSMQRSFESVTDISIQMGDAVKKDPLVINLNGGPAQLGEEKMSFDIDADGNTDRIATLGAGSGFLALDKNGDGKVNDGAELFGSLTGNGFSELAQYDLDGNNWIDEYDPVFNSLSVWENPGEGDGSLLSLKDSGVGAIYLANLATPFDLKDAGNNDLGQVKASGIYLAEDVGVGTVQQLDLAV
jgi:hypothetical protein